LGRHSHHARLRSGRHSGEPAVAPSSPTTAKGRSLWAMPRTGSGRGARWPFVTHLRRRYFQIMVRPGAWRSGGRHRFVKFFGEVRCWLGCGRRAARRPQPRRTPAAQPGNPRRRQEAAGSRRQQPQIQSSPRSAGSACSLRTRPGGTVRWGRGAPHGHQRSANGRDGRLGGRRLNVRPCRVASGLTPRGGAMSSALARRLRSGTDD